MTPDGGAMSEGGEDAEPSGGRGATASLAAFRPRSAGAICFDRRELNQILSVYGRRVAAGEWRGYAIDHRREEAVFSIFRRASEVPLYRIVKKPQLARRQGAYAVRAGGYILKRGHDLRQVLFALDRGLKLVKA